MADHIVKAYDEELNHLAADVARMGGLAEAGVSDAIDTVTRRDLSVVQTVIERDLKLDALDAEIERRSIRLIALRQPVAQDLRRTVAAMKTAQNLERIGDHATNIAEIVHYQISGEDLPAERPKWDSLTRVGGEA